MQDNSISILIQAKDQASAQLSKVAGEVKTLGETSENAAPRTDRFNSALSGTAAMVKGVAIAFATYEVGHLIGDFVSTTFGAAGELEQTNLAFQSLIGNAQDANSIFAQLIQYANVTPFQSKDIIQAAQTLLGFGAAGQQTVDIIKQLGDVVSVGGGNLQQLSLVTGQIFAQGKLRAQDMYQVINDGGAGLIKIMAANAGGMQNLTAEFDKGGIPAKQYFDAINQATANGGFAFQGAGKEAQTFNGRLSTLKDSATQFGEALIGVKTDPKLGLVIQPGGLFDRLSKAFASLSDELQKLKPTIENVMPKLLNGFSRLVESVKNTVSWIVKHRKALLEVAAAITTFLLPALTQMAARSVAAAAKSAASAAVSSTAWIRSAVATSARFYIEMAKVIASFVLTATKAVIHAAAVTAAWVANAAKTSAVWVVTEMPKIIASFALVAVKSVLYAADTSLAWVLNAARTSSEWVVLQMPKLVASFVVTAASAVFNAAATSAAWITNAAKTSFTWVVTELPKIVGGFVVTAASAVFNAATSSASWVASAVASATAWVVTELPRIIAAFAVTAGAAVVNAAIATAAWVGSATASTQSFVAFRALVASPIAMGGISVVAALADIALVYNAVLSVKKAISDVNAAAASAKNASDAMAQRIATDKQLIKSGTAAQKSRAAADLQSLGPLSLASGGFTGRGGVNEIAGIVHRGEYVIPQSGVNQSTGLPKVFRPDNQKQSAGSGVTLYQTNHIYHDADMTAANRELGYRLAHA